MPSLLFTARFPVFDANVCVGDLYDQPAACRNRVGLLTEMDRHGVGRALIYHVQAETISPIDGNRYLHEWLGTDGRLEAQWLVMPTEDSLAQIQALRRQGQVRSVRLFNSREVGLPFLPWAYGDLLTWLSEESIPLWIALPEANLNELITTLQAYPKLVTVLVGAHYSHALWVRPLLQMVPNAHLELSRYESIGEYEALCDCFGAVRLIYGSWYWRYAMGPMLYYLHHTRLRDDELSLICAGNLERILRGERRHD